MVHCIHSFPHLENMCILTRFSFLLCFILPFEFMALFIDSSCERFWESNQELHACYQFNLYTILTWSQALSTCQAQGGNLLSITSLAEHRYIRGRHLVENTCKDRKAAEWNIHHVLYLHHYRYSTCCNSNSTLELELHYTTLYRFFIHTASD